MLNARNPASEIILSTSAPSQIPSTMFAMVGMMRILRERRNERIAGSS
jgi:hypothetical protein